MQFTAYLEDVTEDMMGTIFGEKKIQATALCCMVQFINKDAKRKKDKNNQADPRKISPPKL